MADKELSELLKTQISLTEWLQAINHRDAEVLRKEDGTKRPRMSVLNEVIGLPYDKAEYFDGPEITPSNPRFATILRYRADELCAFRLVPKDDSLPKLRNRGKTVTRAYEWFLEQKIDVSKYRLEVIPHNDEFRWATIFVVNQHGIFGEIVWGGHHLLTQGFHGDAKPIVFAFDFKQWHLEPDNLNAKRHLEQLINLICVPEKSKQAELHERLGSTFTKTYINGYFETTETGAGTSYTDYSIKLGELYADLSIDLDTKSPDALLKGQVGCKGKATGPVVVVDPDHIDGPFPEGSVLVCKVTTPDFVPLMQRAAAIVTDQGGILSHAAIVARELHVPCIVGTKLATTLLTSGQTVTVDADSGVVY